MEYLIYQPISEMDHENLIFELFAGKINLSKYELVFRGNIKKKYGIYYTLESIFQYIAFETPENYYSKREYLMDIGDIVKLENKYYFCLADEGEWYEVEVFSNPRYLRLVK